MIDNLRSVERGWWLDWMPHANLIQNARFWIKFGRTWSELISQIHIELVYSSNKMYLAFVKTLLHSPLIVRHMWRLVLMNIFQKIFIQGKFLETNTMLAASACQENFLKEHSAPAHRLNWFAFRWNHCMELSRSCCWNNTGKGAEDDAGAAELTDGAAQISGWATEVAKHWNSRNPWSYLHL